MCADWRFGNVRTMTCLFAMYARVLVFFTISAFVARVPLPFVAMLHTCFRVELLLVADHLSSTAASAGLIWPDIFLKFFLVALWHWETWSYQSCLETIF